MKFVHYTNCPVCNSSKIAAVSESKDETVSKELFQVWECSHCSVRFTQDVPGVEYIDGYYKSDAYISHSNTSKGFINKLYHLVRSFTLGSKKRLVQKTSAKIENSLLDIGAGTGAFTSTMQKAGWHVTGLEPDQTARTNAKEQYNILLHPPEHLFSLAPASFNAITLWHVLEHVHELHTYLDTFYSLLSEGGSLIIAVPNYKSYDATVYSGAWAAYDVPRHLYHFSPESMKHLLYQHGFKIKKYIPMWFDSFYISLLSEKYLTGKTRPVKAFLTGLVSNLYALRNTSKCSSIIYIAKK
jgi:2-polyprenyl-3-methyl-5-hydroxy-6-metoxy-1,4-benzoquinol methylase